MLWSHKIRFMHSQKSIILKPQVLIEEVRRFADEQNWLLVATQDASAEDELSFELAWITGNGKTAVHLLDDREVLDYWQFPFYLDTLYLVIEGESLDAMEERVRVHFPTFNLMDIIRLIENTKEPNELARYVGYLGSIIPEKFDPYIFKVLEQMLMHEEAEVRLAAVWAAGSTSWANCREKLAFMARTDASGRVVEMASSLLPAFEEGFEPMSRLLKVLD